MILNSPNFYLSEKLLISLSILHEIFVRYSNLGCRFFPFSTLNIPCHSLLACRVSTERSAVRCMGFPLYVTCCFSLAAFNILSLCLVLLVWLLCVLVCFSLVYPIWDSLCLLDLIDYFLFHVGEIFSYNLYKNFLIPFLFLFLWDLYNLNVGVLILSQRSLRISSVLFHYFYFILLFRSYFHHFIFQLTDSFFFFR